MGDDSALDYRAAAAEIEKIVWGAVHHRQEVDSKLAGHWAGRVIGAAIGSRSARIRAELQQEWDEWTASVIADEQDARTSGGSGTV